MSAIILAPWGVGVAFLIALVMLLQCGAALLFMAHLRLVAAVSLLWGLLGGLLLAALLSGVSA